MPPYVFGKDDEGFYKPFQYLHPGIGKTAFKESQPHVFQQSVTLTASMWNEEDSRGSMDWQFGNWQKFDEYSSLFVGLACGFGIVLLVLSTVVLWRYCILGAAKKVCCQSNYGEITCRQKSFQRKEDVESQNGFEHFQNLSTINRKPSTLQRSATASDLSWQNSVVEYEKGSKITGSSENCNMFSHSQTTQTIPFDSVQYPDLYMSHLYLHNLNTSNLESSTNLSRSTTSPVEELYAKVNFSKKKKNRMRKDEAAIIALSKSHSGQNNNSLDLFGSAIVVYNERTAL